MTFGEAQTKFKQTGNLQDYISDTLEAYKDQLASDKRITDKRYQNMNSAIYWCKKLVLDCLEDYNKANGHN